MQSQFIAAINQISAEKNIPRDIVMEAVKSAFRTAYRKEYGNKNQNIDVELSENAENATVYLLKTVAKEVVDPDLEIDLKEAKKYNKKAKVEDVIKIDVTPAVGYGRIAAQAAKQVIMQRLQEAERDLVFKKFKDRENELLTALVHRVERDNVYINLENITIPLGADQKIPNEHLNPGQRIKLYLEKVIKTSKGPQLLISRTHPELIRKLMENEIPEIQDGIVEIKAIAREAGVRCKVAVYSKDPKIDPVGSSVGQKGVRIQAVTNEIGDERIDIIPWSEDQAKFLESALAPATVGKIVIDSKTARASVYVHEDQRALAIGRNGQNVRLASKLTKLEVDIKNIEENPAVADKIEIKDISELTELDPAIIEKLKIANLTQVEQVKGLSSEDLVDIGLNKEEAKIVIDTMKKVK
ncbi:MAG: transcription termination factor NusA, N utilization substance protein A [Candidatus Peregrinibacteria bacterium GW2011_GWF2_33_10]|nr:MAG: transcription termination factor NusA, N utilization substance protein A [Candidatus Peregrinibacteria bacterium GW2011_GWF2_33_10]OGJ45220.1 MAG: transcription termination factor NusA [Candidatus Peregrinibacteria bacterium RIFOXYA2_FULL_33_21]OGJ46641.1 MAG: transcription termination factor NusA [Candidatus Peregrinibacteria bacterium RIFOXYA12_FULL_33_12]OGJ51144.1 MAG: transcription termination factor NusA [Candidatus Peregrinibacteria bacterium RIFOXYB2_FULL_33_20]